MAWSIYQTTGIVLSRKDHKEVDRRYSILTYDQGKIECLARGGHKPLAKLSPHLEMVAEIDLMMVRGRIHETVAGVERRKAFPNIYQDLSRLMLAQNALHLVDIGTRTHEYDPVLYEMVKGWLEFLDGAPTVSAERAGFLLASFGLKLLAITGYRPELSNCLSCKRTIAPGNYQWHALKGGVVCSDCVNLDQEQWFAAKKMTDETLKLIRFALRESFEDQLRPSLPGEIIISFHDAIESLIISHFPTIPASSLRASCAIC